MEIIVVDKKSNDRTVEMARNFGVRVYVIDAKERCTQMNFGVKNARGEFVYFVGSDFILEPAIIKEAVEKCVVEGFDAVCIHNTSDPNTSFWARVRKLERDCYAGDELNVAARFFRKEVFEKIGGFDEKLVAAEDYDLHNRLLQYGCRVGEIESKEVHIGEPRTLLELARRHYYYGKTIKMFLMENPRRGMKQLGPIRPAFLINAKEFVGHPLLTVGFIVYQTVRYFAAGLGFLVSEVRQ